MRKRLGHSIGYGKKETLQQAIEQQLMPIYEPLFTDGSFGYHPNKSAKDAGFVKIRNEK